MVCSYELDMYSAGIILSSLIFGNREFAEKMTNVIPGKCYSEVYEEYYDLPHEEWRNYVHKEFIELNEKSNRLHKYTDEQIQELAYLVADCMMMQSPQAPYKSIYQCDEITREEFNQHWQEMLIPYRDESGNAYRRPTAEELQFELQKLAFTDVDFSDTSCYK